MNLVNKKEILDNLKDIHKNEFMKSFEESMFKAGGRPDSLIERYKIKELAETLGPNGITFTYKKPEDNLIKKAILIAEKAHEGQFRNDGKPYITHVMAVYNHLKDNWLKYYKDEYVLKEGVYNEVMAAAILHDVVEDTSLTLLDLESFGIPELTRSIVCNLTKKSGETYYNFIFRILNSRNAHFSSIVKRADLWHNMNDNPQEGSRLEKYKFADYILKTAFINKQ